MKKALLFFSIFVSVLVCLSCGKEKEDNSFRMTDSWWMAKGRGGNTNYFFHFTSEDAFDFYDYGVSPLRQQTALYSTKGTMVSNSDGTVQPLPKMNLSEPQLMCHVMQITLPVA